VLSVRWTLATGESGEAVVGRDEKWTFGRPGGDEQPSLTSENPRISRTALTIRDSGPGPVAFRGQRGEGVSVALLGSDGTVAEIPEGTAVNLTESAYRIAVAIDGRRELVVEVDFEPRSSVKERQGQADAAATLDG
jgi:hypothetical protein